MRYQEFGFEQVKFEMLIVESSEQAGVFYLKEERAKPEHLTGRYWDNLKDLKPNHWVRSPRGQTEPSHIEIGQHGQPAKVMKGLTQENQGSGCLEVEWTKGFRLSCCKLVKQNED